MKKRLLTKLCSMAMAAVIVVAGVSVDATAVMGVTNVNAGTIIA